MSQNRAISNRLHTLAIDEDEFELPVFEKTAKPKKDGEAPVVKEKLRKQNFKRFLMEQGNEG